MKSKNNIKRKSISMIMIVTVSVILTGVLTGAGTGFIEGASEFLGISESEKINMTEPVNANIKTELQEENETTDIIYNINYPKIYITPGTTDELHISKEIYKVIVGIIPSNYTMSLDGTELYIDGFLYSIGKQTHIRNFGFDAYIHLVDFSTFSTHKSILKALDKNGELVGTATVNFCEDEPQDLHETNTHPDEPYVMYPLNSYKVGIQYWFTVLSHDVDEDNILWYGFIWDDGTRDLESALQGTKVFVQHAWNEPGTYDVRISVCDEYGGCVDKTITIVVEEYVDVNSLMIPKVPIGETMCMINDPQEYSIIAKSNYYYQFCFDKNEYSPILFGDYSEGEVVTIEHTWTTTGTHTVQVKAISLQITMDKWCESKYSLPLYVKSFVEQEIEI